MPILAPDERTAPPPDLPEDKEAQELQESCNAYLSALIRGTLEEQDEAGLKWDEMAKRKDKENKGK